MNIRCASAVLLLAACAQTPSGPGEVPTFRVDPNWPKPLAEEDGVQSVLGQVSGIAVNERNGHVWIVHRPATLLPDEWDPKQAKPVTHRCCKAAPAVMEFDAAGNALRAWTPSGGAFEWPKSEHGIYIDGDGNVWLAGNGNEDNQILKFTPEGKFLMQIGRAGKSEGSNSRTQLGRPAHMMISGDELFVADGYGNRRVVVFDASTGAWNGLVAPAGTPRAVLQTLHSAVSKALSNPELQRKYGERGIEMVASRSPEDFSAYVKSEAEAFARLVREAGIKVE